jgi:hypothetical protein
MLAKPDDDPSVFREPHMLAQPRDLSKSDALDEEPARGGPIEPDDDDHSARDEPSLQWQADSLGGIDGFAQVVAARRAATPAAARALVLVGLVLVSGPLAVLCAIWSQLGAVGGAGYFAIAVTVPVVEEMAKVAAVLWLVERKPWLLAGSGAIIACGAASGLLFGAIENLLYIHVYFPDAGPELARWRWMVTMPMHAVCSTIAAAGVAVMWRRVMREGTPARIADAFPRIVAAMLIHGANNALAILLSVLGLDLGS